MTRIISLLFLLLNFQTSFSHFMNQESFVKRSGGGTLNHFNPGSVLNNGGFGLTPFTGTNPNHYHQNSFQNRVIKVKESIDRPPELPKSCPIRPFSPKFEKDKSYLDEAKNSDSEKGLKNEGKSKNVKSLSEKYLPLLPGIYHVGFITTNFGPRGIRKVKEICDLACRKAREMKDRFVNQSG